MALEKKSIFDMELFHLMLLSLWTLSGGFHPTLLPILPLNPLQQVSFNRFTSQLSAEARDGGGNEGTDNIKPDMGGVSKKIRLGRRVGGVKEKKRLIECNDPIELRRRLCNSSGGGGDEGTDEGVECLGNLGLPKLSVKEEVYSEELSSMLRDHAVLKLVEVRLDEEQEIAHALMLQDKTRLLCNHRNDYDLIS